MISSLLYRFCPLLCLVVSASSLAVAQTLTYTANPPHVEVSHASAAPFAIPFCSTSDPGVPTPGILYCYAPSMVQGAYNYTPLYQRGIRGAGQTIVIVDAYGSPTIEADLKTFDRAFGLPDPDFRIICPFGCPAFNPRNRPQNEAGWSQETTLDVEWAHAVAPEAKIVLAVAPTPNGDTINNVVKYIIGAYPGSIISQSFGTPEATIHANNSQVRQAHATYAAAVGQGITVLASSGDSGATNGDFPIANASYPASDPFVTGVGGTQGLPEGNLVNPPGCNALPCYGAETVWNEPWSTGAAGGAESSLFAAPSYQDSIGSPNRSVPDVAYDAAVDGGVLVYYSAEGPSTAGFYVFGGTSAGSPQWAGIFALANDARAQAGKAPLGFANPALYSIAVLGSYAADFHDITAGNNTLAGTTVGFSAQPGYDLATGWGTPNVANLVMDLANY
ncbi:MAG TPA: S53 family peptidase [Bryobacteraceae bacterium]|nr:S53 family peptidase [Bryobacteraceae bacterium]